MEIEVREALRVVSPQRALWVPAKVKHGMADPGDHLGTHALANDDKADIHCVEECLPNPSALSCFSPGL